MAAANGKPFGDVRAPSSLAAVPFGGHRLISICAAWFRRTTSHREMSPSASAMSTAIASPPTSAQLSAVIVATSSFSSSDLPRRTASLRAISRSSTCSPPTTVPNPRNSRSTIRYSLFGHDPLTQISALAYVRCHCHRIFRPGAERRHSLEVGARSCGPLTRPFASLHSTGDRSAAIPAHFAAGRPCTTHGCHNGSGDLNVPALRRKLTPWSPTPPTFEPSSRD